MQGTKTKTEVEIIDCDAENVSVLYDLIVELAVYQNTGDQVTLTKDDLKKDGFKGDEHAWFKAKLAKTSDGEIVGHGLYYFKYSLRSLRRKLYLEDIYVRPAWRGTGVGKLLWEAVCKEGVGNQCVGLELTVLSWNKTPISFYEKAGATNISKSPNAKRLLNFDLRIRK